MERAWEIMRHLRAWLLLLFGGCLCGCAQTASLQVWNPAEVNLPGVHRVAVLGFNGPGTAPSAAAAAVTAQLWQNEFFAVVDRAHLEGPVLNLASTGGSASHPGGPGINDFLRGAVWQNCRQAGVQGAIVGDVISYQCIDHVHDETHIGFSGDSTKNQNTRTTGGGFTYDSKEIVNREAVVAVAFRLLDVNSGEVLATRQTTHSFKGTVSAGQGTLPPGEKVLGDLLNQCVDDMTKMLAPTKDKLTVTLAAPGWTTGRSLVDQGNEFAVAGDWKGAEAEYSSATKANEEYSAAWHNLAWARVALSDLAGAEAAAARAVEVDNSRRNRDALQQIRQLSANFTLVQRQLASRYLVRQGLPAALPQPQPMPAAIPHVLPPPVIPSGP